MTVKTEVKIHETPAEIYEALSRVFDEEANGEHRWVTIVSEGVEVTFFATRVRTPAQVEDTARKAVA